MFSFIATVVLAKSVLFSVVLMTAGGLLRFLPQRQKLVASIGFVLILAGYLYAWFFFLSSFDRLRFLLRTGLSGWTTLCVNMVILYFIRNTDRLVEAGSLAWPLLLIGCFVGL